MAPPQKAGLQAFASSYYDASTTPGFGNPFNPNRGTGASGLSQLQSQLVDQKIQDEAEIKSLESALLTTNKPPETGPRVLFSPGQNKLFVNGALYDADDKQSALDAEARGFLDKPRASQPEGADWQTVSPESYKTFMNNIENPGLGTLFARNFEIGGSNLKLLAGRGAQFLGAEETGQSVVDNAVQELYFNQPFQREFTEINTDQDSHGAIDWFVANLAQQGPNLIESIGVALLGAGAGAVAGGGANPFTAAGGAIYSLLGKEAVKKSVIKASQKYMKGQALTKGEKKILREFSGLKAAADIRQQRKGFFEDKKVGRAFSKKKIEKGKGEQLTVKQPKPGGIVAQQELRRSQAADSLAAGALKAKGKARTQAIAGGAAIGSLAGSYAMGVADIYGEVRDTGVGDRGTAALGAIPYAALETLPEFLLAGRIFGLGADAITSGGRIKRAGKGLFVGGTLEGLTEVGQEGILLAATNQLGDAEVTKRLINSFAAGFAIGGPLGGGANLLKRNEPTNILDKEDPAADKGITPPGGGSASPVVPGGSATQNLEQPDLFPGSAAVAQAETAGQLRLDATTDIAADTETTQTQEPQPQVAQQLNLPLPNPTGTGTAQDITDTVIEGQGQETAMGQQLLQAANIKIAQQEQQLAEQETARLQAAELQQRQREFEAAEKEILDRKIKELEESRIAQILAENDRLTREIENREARKRDMINVPMQGEQRLNQLSLPGMGLPYSARRQALLRGQQEQRTFTTQEIEEIKAAERQRVEEEQKAKEDAGQLNLFNPLAPAPVPVSEINTPVQDAADKDPQGEAPPELLQPLIDGMRKKEIPANKIQEYIDNFSNAVANNNVEEATEVIEDMRLVVNEEAPKVVNLQRGIETSTKSKTPEKPKTINITKEIENALSEQSTNEVDVQEQTGTSAAVPIGDTQGQETTGKNRLQEQVRKASNLQTKTIGKEEDRALREAREDAIRQRIQESETRISTVYVNTKGKTPVELWNELSPKGSLSYSRLPRIFKKTWVDLIATGTVNGDIAKEINDKAFLSPLITITNQEELNSLMGGFDTTTDFSANGEAQMQAELLVDIAFFTSDEETASKAERKEVAEYVNKIDNKTPSQRRLLQQAFLKLADSQEILYGTGVRNKPAKINNPWLDYALDNYLLKDIKQAAGKFLNMPVWYQSDAQLLLDQAVREGTEGQPLGQTAVDALFDSVRERQAAGEKVDFVQFREAYEAALGTKGKKIVAEKQIELLLDNSRQLEDIIKSHLDRYDYKSFSGVNPVIEIKTDADTDKATQRINRLFANSNPKYLMANGYALQDYFDSAGKLKLERKANGRYVPDPTPEAQPGDVLRTGTQTNKLKSNPEILNEMDSKDTEGKFSRADGKPADPMGKGEIDLIVKQVLKKLKVKPTVTIVANVQELARTNPALYARAQEGRPLGDFDTVQAVGYSVGDQVIIFSDYAKDKQQIRTVIAHETLGHFGFRAFMPRSRMSALFREIYRTDGHVKAAADIMMNSNPNIDLLEAVEEVLAERAGSLDVRMIDRLKNIIQAVLDVVGLGDWIAVGDPDLTRYFLNQSRKNLRTGGRGVVGAQQLALNLKQLQSESEYGRFQIEDIRSDAASTFLQSDALNRKSGPFGGFANISELLKNTPRGQAKKLRLTLANISEAVQTLDNKAQRSEGLSKIFKIFQLSTGKTRRAMAEYERLTAFTHTPNWFGNGKGPTKEELEQAGDMLAYGALYKQEQNTEQMLSEIDDLINSESGTPQINDAVRKRLEEMGTISREEFEQGFTVIVGGAPDSKTFTVTDNTYRIYRENRAAVAQAAIDVLEANIAAARGQREQAVNNFSTFVGETNNRPTAEDVQIFRRIIQEYENLYQENATLDGPVKASKDKAKAFIGAINRAFHEDKKVQDWVNGREDTAQFQGDRYKDIVEAIPRLRDIRFSTDTAYSITNTIQNLLSLTQAARNADSNAKRTIATGYVPFARRGDWQVRVQAYDKNGRPVSLDEATAGTLPYFQASTEQDADDIAKGLQDMTADNTDTPITYTLRNREGTPIEVQFKAQVSKARKSQPLTHSLNLTEFMGVVSRLDIGLTPQERERVFTALTSQQSRARKSLQRTRNPGWDKDVVRSVAEHLETMGHIAGKSTYSWQLNDILINDGLFKGDVQKLKALEAATTQGTETQREQAKKAYDAYAYQYSFMAEKGAPQAKDRNGNEIENKGRGEDYREDAKELLAFYGDSTDISTSTEDILSEGFGSKLKLFAVLLQLGGSVATAAVNMVSMATHTIPYLGTYNPNRGYGGGFGLGASAGAMTRAIRNAGNPKLANYDYMLKVANPKRNPAMEAEAATLREKHGLTQDEADAMYEATAAGVLQAAQFNALVGTSRGGRNSNTFNGAIKAWMSAFSYTEQLNRRSTFLASYRLEREKLKANVDGNLLKTDQREIQLQAQEFATKAVNTSQGEYAMYNRPEMARGNVAQYIFMYKQFVIISIQLMKGLPPSGRLAMLSMLFLMAGMKGLPFADDIMDLIDTLIQKFGIKMKSVEEETARLVDSFIPGATPFFMRGILDSLSGATISTRLGFGDLVPLTGMFKAKSHAGEHWQEAKNFAGPVFSGIAGLFGTAGQLVRYGAEVVGLKDDTTRFKDILRDTPSSAVRGLFDGMTYLSDGKITRADGTVLDNEVGTLTAITRMMGFYPYQVMVQNDIIRMTKQSQAYSQDLKSHYRQAYIKAKLDKDRGEMRRIVSFVREHNKDVGPKSEFYFKNFIQSANKSYNSAKRNSLNRFRKFAPKQIRPVIDEMQGIYSVD